MNKVLPFGLSVIIFILVWCSLLYLPHLETLTTNKAITYATIAMFIAIISFVMFATIYRFENIHIRKEDLIEEFRFNYKDVFQFY